MNSNSLVVV